MSHMVKFSDLNPSPNCDYTGRQLPDEYIAKLETVTAKRARRVIDAILKKGYVKQSDLEAMGYTHGPRAIRDVRELGFGIVTARDVDGFAVYAFDKPVDEVNLLSKSRGRTVLEKEIRHALVTKYGAKDFITLETLDETMLQVDHRVPYEIGGEPEHSDLTKFMLLSGSTNRLKSHACENCPNWEKKKYSVCESCFWASPEDYSHVACKPERPVLLVFTGEEAEIIRQAQEKYGEQLEEIAKKSLLESLSIEWYEGEN